MSAFILSHEDYKFIGSCLLGYAISPIGSIHWWDTWNFLGSGFEVESPRYKADRETALKAVNKKLQALYLMNVEAVNHRKTALEAVNKKLQALYLMNVEAVNQRYKAKYNIDELDLDLHPKTDSAHKFIEMLGCLSYNCAEGNVPDTQLFKDLGSYISRLYEEEVREY